MCVPVSEVASDVDPAAVQLNDTLVCVYVCVCHLCRQVQGQFHCTYIQCILRHRSC